jgi:hypothetical protein
MKTLLPIWTVTREYPLPALASGLSMVKYEHGDAPTTAFGSLLKLTEAMVGEPSLV